MPPVQFPDVAIFAPEYRLNTHHREQDTNFRNIIITGHRLSIDTAAGAAVRNS